MKIKLNRQQSDVLSAREASELLNVSEPMIRKMYRNGIIPGLKVGRFLRFSRQALLDALKRYSN